MAAVQWSTWRCFGCERELTGPWPRVPVQCIDCTVAAVENTLAIIVPGYDKTAENDMPVAGDALWGHAWDTRYLEPATPEKRGGQWGGARVWYEPFWTGEAGRQPWHVTSVVCAPT